MKTILLVLCSFAAFGQQQKSIEIKIDDFRQQRNFGREVQAIGLGIAAASLIAPKGNHLPFVGAVFFSAGFAIDWNASKHLRISPRKKRARK